MSTTTTNTNASVNVASVKEEMEMKTKNELREMLRVAGIELSNTQFKKTRKDDLIAMLEATTVTESVVEEKKEESDMKAKYMDAKWDKLVMALAAEYVKQSLNRSWALFYKNTRATTTKAEYLVKSNRLWGVTSKVIKTLYGDSNCNEGYIQQALNAMVVRGYLNYQKVNGKDGGVNVVFNATKDQMNAMWKLAKQ